MTRLFISYSSKNRDLVNRLATLLIDAGYDVIYDQQIPSGSWWTKILADIRACDIFLYAVTTEYLDSYPCDLEYHYAEALHRPMCAVRVTTLDFGRVPPHIALAQVIDLSSLDQNSQSLPTRLIRALKDLETQTMPLPSPLPAEPVPPISKLNEVIDHIVQWDVTLSPTEQKLLLEDIRGLLYKPESRTYARYALERYRKRAERDEGMLARVTDEIDSLLALTASDMTPPPQPTHARSLVTPPGTAQVQTTRSRTPLFVGLAVVIAFLVIGSLVVLGGRGTGSSIASATSTPAITGTSDVALAATGTSSPITPLVTLSVNDLANTQDAQDALTVAAGQTKTATLWTPTPTPNLGASAIVLRTERAAGTMTQVANGLSAIAALWTRTFTPTATITLTTKPSNTPTATLTRTPDVVTIPLRTFIGHTGPIFTAVFSLDGSTILTGSLDHTAILWSTQTGTAPLRTFTGHTGAVLTVAYAPAGYAVLTGSVDTTAILWNIETGAKLRVLISFTDYVESVAFAPDGQSILIGSRDNMASLWNTGTGAKIRTFSGHTGAVASAVYSPDGKTILTGSTDNTAILWDVQTGAKLHIFSGHTSAVRAVAFSPDGSTILTGSNDSTAILWDIRTGTKLLTFSGHRANINGIAYAPDGKTILTASSDGKAILWDGKTGARLRTFSGHIGAVYSVAYGPDGKMILTAGDDKTAKLWDISALVSGASISVALADTVKRVPPTAAPVVTLGVGSVRTDDRGISQVYVPAGCFPMGSDPRKIVRRNQTSSHSIRCVSPAAIGSTNST